jgi:hypothetical protein
MSVPKKNNISISRCAVPRYVTVMLIASARGNKGFARFRQLRLRPRLSERVGNGSETRERAWSLGKYNLANICTVTGLHCAFIRASASAPLPKNTYRSYGA